MNKSVEGRWTRVECQSVRINKDVWGLTVLFVAFLVVSGCVTGTNTELTRTSADAPRTNTNVPALPVWPAVPGLLPQQVSRQLSAHDDNGLPASLAEFYAVRSLGDGGYELQPNGEVTINERWLINYNFTAQLAGWEPDAVAKTTPGVFGTNSFPRWRLTAAQAEWFWRADSAMRATNNLALRSVQTPATP